MTDQACLTPDDILRILENLGPEEDPDKVLLHMESEVASFMSTDEYCYWRGHLLDEATGRYWDRARSSTLRMQILNATETEKLREFFDQLYTRVHLLAHKDAVAKYLEDSPMIPDPDEAPRTVPHPWPADILELGRQIMDLSPYRIWRLSKDVEAVAQEALQRIVFYIVVVSNDGREVSREIKEAGAKIVNDFIKGLRDSVGVTTPCAGACADTGSEIDPTSAHPPGDRSTGSLPERPVPGEPAASGVSPHANKCRGAWGSTRTMRGPLCPPVANPYAPRTAP